MSYLLILIKLLLGDSAGAQLTSQYVAMQTNEDLRDEMHFEQQFKPSQIKAAVFLVVL